MTSSVTVPNMLKITWSPVTMSLMLNKRVYFLFKHLIFSLLHVIEPKQGGRQNIRWLCSALSYGWVSPQAIAVFIESSLVILVETQGLCGGSAASLHQMKRASCGAFLAFRLKETPKANSGFRFNWLIEAHMKVFVKKPDGSCSVLNDTAPSLLSAIPPQSLRRTASAGIRWGEEIAPRAQRCLTLTFNQETQINKRFFYGTFQLAELFDGSQLFNATPRVMGKHLDSCIIAHYKIRFSTLNCDWMNHIWNRRTIANKRRQSLH